MTLADRMAVFMDGEVQQIGRPTEVFARPNSIDVAAFIGSPPMNLIPARYARGRATIAGGTLQTAVDIPGEQDVIIGIRPGAVRFEDAGMPATVELVEHLGDTAVLDLDLAGAAVRARVSDGPVPREGERVTITARPADVHVFDAASGKRL